eukprot:214978_1
MAEQTALIPPPPPPASEIRIKLQEFFESDWFHAALGILITIDLSIVLLEIALILLYCEDIPHNIHSTTHNLVYVSIGILGVFLLELTLQMYAFGPKPWCSHCLHVFDFIVVLVTFVAEIYFLNDERAEALVGLIIVFRLWRLVRVIHVTAEALENQSEMQVHHMKQKIKELEKRLSKYEAAETALTASNKGALI